MGCAEVLYGAEECVYRDLTGVGFDLDDGPG
jgi:hypothetical protein